jgi:serine/threonine protein kinase/tetratricopeptide (TPR) repeat protein
MTYEPGVWARIKEVFDGARVLAVPDRPAFVASACAGDTALQSEVERLLAAHQVAGSFLQAPAMLSGTSAASLALENGSIAGYELVAFLGAGGMGEVYKAYDAKLERPVALKLLSTQLSHDPDRLQRFRAEARAASALNHPHILVVHDFGDFDGRPFIVTEFVEGQTLRERMNLTPFAMKDAVGVATQIASALAAAHARGIVHRDIKPENVILRPDGYVKVLDFGLARQTLRDDPGTRSASEPGALIGTLRYMSPEQSRGLSVGAPSDVFSLGLVFFEMITGRHPFHAESSIGVLHSIQSSAPSAAGAGPEIDDLIQQMLQKDAATRPSAGEVAERLTGLATRTEAMAYVVQQVREPSLDHETSAATANDSGRSGRTSFVGRDAERASLGRHVEQAHMGHGTLVLISGEPGVGKTRLVGQILADARARGWLSLSGHCYETAGTPPFIPFVELVERVGRAMPAAMFREVLGDAAPEIARLTPELRRTFSDIGQSLDLPPEQQRRYLFNCVVEFIERCCRLKPLVVLLDDLHWADEPTLRLLEHLAQRLPQLPMIVLGTYRDVELDADRPFAAALETLTRQRLAHRLPLKGLSEESVDAMLRALGGTAPPPPLVAAVYRETEGNPFFVEEVFHHLHDEDQLFDQKGRWRTNLRMDELNVPESVRLVIGRRLKRLQETTQHILTRAALVGRSFDLSLLTAVTDERDETLLTALEEAETAHVVRLESGRHIRWVFVHELIRQSLVARLALPRRQRLHLHTATALEHLYASSLDSHAGDLAHHFYQAGAIADPGRTIQYLSLAADQALHTSAFEEALADLERALTLSDGVDARLTADLQEKKAIALRSLGRSEDATKAWGIALAHHKQLGHIDGIARTCYEIGNQQWWLNRWRESEATCMAGLDAVVSAETANACRLLALSGYVVGANNDYSAGTRMLDDAERAAARLGDRRLLGQVLSRRAQLCNMYGEFRQAADIGERAADALREVGDLWELADALGFLELNLNYVDRLKDGVSCDEELRPLALRLGHYTALTCADWATLPRNLMQTGDLDAFDAAARQKLDMWQRAGVPLFPSHLFVAAAQFWRGQWHESVASFERAAAVGFYPSWVDMIWGWLFLAKAYVKDDGALALLDSKRSLLPSLGTPASSGSCHLPQLAVEGLAMLGQAREAYGLYPVLLQLMPMRATGFAVGLLATSAGIAAACGGEWAAAERHFETAVRQAQEMPHKIAQPETRRWYAWMLSTRGAPGDRDRARRLLGEAVDMYRAIGMPGHVEIAGRIRERL